MYLGAITIDYTDTQRYRYQQLISAVLQAPGWRYAETSALVYRDEDLTGLRLALETMARAIEEGGTLSALSVQVQRVGESKEYAAAKRQHRYALHSILSGLPLPDSPHRSERIRT